MFEKVWNRFKQKFHYCKNTPLSSFGSIYWLNILEYIPEKHCDGDPLSGKLQA